MLINVFGFWLMTTGIIGLYHQGEAKCDIITVKGGIDITINHSCEEVAAEINKQIKESK